MSVIAGGGRLLLLLVGVGLTLLLAWQTSPAGWGPPAEPPGREATGRLPERPGRVIAEGRLAAYPGAEVHVGTEVLGTIVVLAVEEKAAVRRGDLIAELRSDDLRASKAEAESRIAEAEADIRFFERETVRAERLQSRKAGTPLEVDSSRRQLDAARARRAAAAATRDRFVALLAKTRIVSPIDGVVIARHVQPGETVEAATCLVTVVDLRRVRVEAEVDEFDAASIALGADAVVTAEGYGGRGWRGVVEEIPDSVVGRRIRPEDPSRPTDTRILLVKIALKEETPLKLGQKVEVVILNAPGSR